jgi:uncharacterized protein (DUF58 family)
MSVSYKFAYLIFAGIFVQIVASFFNITLLVFFIYNILLIIMLCADFLVSARKDDFEISRKASNFLSLAIENKFQIKVNNLSKKTYNLEILDEIPEFFTFKREIIELTCEKKSENFVNYIVYPKKRGNYKFGNIHIRFEGVLGLCKKQFIYEMEKEYKVYPNIRDLTKYGLKFLDKNSFFEGIKKHKHFHGESEFDSLREYSIGDDTRKINWKASARLSKLVVNNFEDDKNQQVIVLIDTSRGMNSEIGELKKLDYVVNASFLLTDIAIRKGDKVGCLVFDSKIRKYIPIGKGQAHFKHISDKIYDISENIVSANYDIAFEYLNSVNRKRSLLCIFTEIFDLEEAKEIIYSISQNAKNYVPIIFTIRDENAIKMASKDIKNIDDIYEKSTALKFLEERKKILDLFKKSSILCIDISPDKLSAQVINSYLALKSKI